ncbi:MAG: prepilin-type N-terminal cleavage/methylation domain-containing protein [Glaciimonas sp.]|nr:prepilin-type N-terminal cleavage/methylation domain-containing protein [Glaciimonas sp.]
MMMKNKKAGFTLIEILIVTVIVVLLSAIAIPNYLTHIQRSKRIAAGVTLHKAAHWMERRFTINHSYLNDDGSLPTLPMGLNQSPKTGAANYVISLIVSDTSLATYKLQATPQKVDKCGMLLLDQTGARSVSNAMATLEECWGG